MAKESSNLLYVFQRGHLAYRSSLFLVDMCSSVINDMFQISQFSLDELTFLSIDSSRFTLWSRRNSSFRLVRSWANVLPITMILSRYSNAWGSTSGTMTKSNVKCEFINMIRRYFDLVDAYFIQYTVFWCVCAGFGNPPHVLWRPNTFTLAIGFSFMVVVGVPRVCMNGIRPVIRGFGYFNRFEINQTFW